MPRCSAELDGCRCEQIGGHFGDHKAMTGPEKLLIWKGR
jgi:hypothetical protein